MSTRQKSDIGVAVVTTDLIKQGWIVCRPLSEHAPFDLVVVKGIEKFTIQVKCRTMRNGTLEACLEKSWSNRSGKQVTQYLDTDFDYLAITDGDQYVGYIPMTEISTNKMTGSVTLRVLEAKNTNNKIRSIAKYRTLGFGQGTRITLAT